MEHYSPLPLALVFAIVGAFACATVTYLASGGILLALLAYSIGGAISLIGSAAALSMRIQVHADSRTGSTPRQHQAQEAAA